tara:strand:- start:151 stop:345 length:195 start_codon:yes stop_codon:yes gene_type:complete
MSYKVKDIETGKVLKWSLSKILREINRDRSEDWTDYDVSDWREGWEHWIEGDVYTMLENKEYKL